MSIRKRLIKRLDKVFSEYIRRRKSKNDISECYTCGKKDYWKNLQCGHFQSRRHLSTRWDETNCQVQCAGCNVFRYGEQFRFGSRLVEEYGSNIALELEQKARIPSKFSNKDLEDKIEYYKDLIKSFDKSKK